jgi:hypothetical protein
MRDTALVNNLAGVMSCLKAVRGGPTPHALTWSPTSS